MELIALGLLAIATVVGGVITTIHCSKAERRYMQELKEIEAAKKAMTSFKKAELKRLLAARAALV